MLDRLLRWVDQLLCTHGHVVLRGGRSVCAYCGKPTPWSRP